jgi:signal transduction histidine kinase
MDRMKNSKPLLRAMTSQLTVCLVVILLASTPLFYLIVTNYYAEDLLRVAKMAGVPPSSLDLERDTLAGLLIQIVFILAIIAVSVAIVMKLIPQRLWAPFYETISKLGSFRVENGYVPELPKSDIREFNQLNETLSRLLQTNIKSYMVQKEFTENASHELQTPLAVAQNKLDLLLQDEHLTEKQAALVQDVYGQLKQMSALSRGLLLLAKLENNQFRLLDEVRVSDILNRSLPSLEALSGNLHVDVRKEGDPMVRCQTMLLQSLINNLVVNAVRHNRPGGTITIEVGSRQLTVSNTSDEPAIDSTHIFDRFYRSSESQKGNGLGLAIVKAICDYHHWTVGYHFTPNAAPQPGGIHSFEVRF